jgi:hypothetical protein
MPISVKVSAGNKFKEPGYYPANFVGYTLQHSKTEDGSDLILVELEVDYDGEMISYIDKCYTSISETSKLASLAVAVGLYETVQECVEYCEETGELPDLDPKFGSPVRAHFDKRASKDGRSYISLVGYEKPRQSKGRPVGNHASPKFGDDIPF